MYLWGGLPLIAGGLCLALAARPAIVAAPGTRVLDRALVAALVLVALQIAPLPARVVALVSPSAADVRSSLTLLSDGRGQWPALSVAPASTAYALGLIATGVVAFWASRQASHGTARLLVSAVGIVGLLVTLAAIVQYATSPRLIYGLWLPRDEGARPFGPFVNRNHFATWALLAISLAAGRVAASLARRRPASSRAAAVAVALRGAGSLTMWVVVGICVMAVGLLVSSSRSGLVGFAASLVALVWLGRTRADGRTRLWGVAAAVAMTAMVLAYVNLQPLALRLEETLSDGAGGRPRIWAETLALARDFWISGTGVGGYQTAMLMYQPDDLFVFLNHAHNQYLQLVAEGGVLLGIPVVVCVATFVLLCRDRLSHDTSPEAWLRIGAIAGLIAVGIQSVWETGLRIPANGLLFAVAAGIAVRSNARE